MRKDKGSPSPRLCSAASVQYGGLLGLSAQSLLNIKHLHTSYRRQREIISDYFVILLQRQNGDIRISSATVLNVASPTKWGHLKLVSDCFVISLQRQNGDIGISSATVLQCRFSDKMETLKYHQRLFCNVASAKKCGH